jgi:hypothetical protein
MPPADFTDQLRAEKGRCRQLRRMAQDRRSQTLQELARRFLVDRILVVTRTLQTIAGR